MPNFTVPGPEVSDLLKQVMDQYHPELVKADVKIGLLYAWPSSDGGDALMLHGYPAAAVVKKTSLRDRVQGIDDAVITINGPTWKGLDDDEKIALLDHECTHLEVCYDEEEGGVATDDAGRPKLKIRLHDFQVGWFKSIADRHGMASFEVKQAQTLKTDWGQLLWDFADTHERKAKAKPKSAKESDLIQDTFASLLAVGHTDSQARAAIDRALSGVKGPKCRTVSELIDAIYEDSRSAEPDMSTITLGVEQFQKIGEAAKALRKAATGS